MGLDMYLSAKRYFWSNEREEICKEISKAIPELAGVPINEITAEAGYWRKANHIHKWFVDNVQGGVDNCRAYTLSTKKLLELRNACQQVLNDNTLANTVLPREEGFFFGSNDVDDWYFEDLRDTVRIIDEAVQKYPEKSWEFEYRSSW